MRNLMVGITLAALALPAAPALAQRATPGYTLRTTIMRAGPDRDYPFVRRVPRNAEVEIFGCLADRSWCDTGYRYDRGWVPARDLVVEHRGRRLGIEVYPGIGVLTFLFGSYWDSHYRGRDFYSQRPRWERQYYDNYQPHWGPRPPAPRPFEQPRRPGLQPGRPTPQPGQGPQPQFHPQPQPQLHPQPQPQLHPQPQPQFHPQPQPQVHPQPQPQLHSQPQPQLHPQPQPRAQPQPQPRPTPHSMILFPQQGRGGPAPGNPPPPNAQHGSPTPKATPTEAHRKKDEGPK